MTNEVFVFGSNLAGVHGKGAALTARREHGAVQGIGEGYMGNSYALPTKDARIRSRSIQDIATSVLKFIAFARANPQLHFKVTRVGCGLAGYKDHEIAPLFESAPENCMFSDMWRGYLPNHTTFPESNPPIQRKPNMTQLFYSGIGSRETPPAIQQIMRTIAAELGSRGWTLRSGHAEGADIAFELGAKDLPKEIYLPWQGFNGGRAGIDGAIDPAYLSNYKQAMVYAEHFHPAWEKCSRGARSLHTRNIYQILGQDLNTPVTCVICWTKDGKSSGGTGQALRLAEYLEIPIFNLHDPAQLDKLADYVLTAELEHAK